jgi:serine/threonine-protein kinase
VADLFSTASIPDALIGRRLDGRYEVLERLGAGGVGVVYRAKHAQLGRLVAIKVLQQHAAAQTEWRRRFEREAKALSALAHPNIVTVTDSGLDDGLPYLVMELLQGKILSELINEGPLSPQRAIDIARQLLRGLAFAHGKGIVHRDLKPANVFLQTLPDQADHVRLLDFGMAKFLEGSGSRSLVENLTQVGMVCGTPSYMCPEQWRGEPVDARTDVYSAGVLLFELFAGRPPFGGETFQETMKAHLLDPIPSLADARPDLSIAPFFQPVVERAMAKKAVERYQNAASMLAALEATDTASRVAAARGGLAAVGQKPPSRVHRARELVAHSWRVAVTVATLAAALTTVFTFLRRDGSKPGENARPAALQQAPSNVLVPPAAGSTTSRTSLPQATTRPHAEGERSGLPSRNPWQEEVPAALKPIRDRIDRGGRMSEMSLRPVYLFARQHPDDPRPWLLVGRAYAQLDWLSDAVERYLRAYRIDPGSRGDPQMLADLLKAAQHPVAGRAAAKAISEVYGAEAIPAVDKALQHPGGERDATTRLTRLRESLMR